MAERYTSLPDLKRRFTQFHEISSITQRLRLRLDHIHEENRTAAGTDDEVAKTYHKQVDGPANNLSEFVSQIQQNFWLYGDKGVTTSTYFDVAEDNATDTAHGA
ncbi:hypothetical protein ACIGNX_01535 [Actinosynnema sp. NPDC053489]|uniref:hypothetical protein n=1 Tax=Actinosynnema sp. NPDC053489 TaxID=3363916 RepID=UPI0037C7D984